MFSGFNVINGVPIDLICLWLALAMASDLVLRNFWFTKEATIPQVNLPW